MKRLLPLLILTFFLTACATPGTLEQQWVFFDKYNLPKPTREGFTVCYGMGCKLQGDVHLSPKQWQTIASMFKNPNRTPAQERLIIARAIGQMEAYAGAQTETGMDKGENKPGRGLPGQLDCVDESVNSTQYLLLFQQEGLLKHHQVLRVASRGFFIAGWPHNTASIQDLTTGEAYVVDSWFLDNGADAQVVPIDPWMGRWSPEKENATGAHRIDDNGQWTPLPDWLAE